MLDKSRTKKAISMWFKLADKVAERYRIPFTEIDELAKFMQSAAYQIAHHGDCVPQVDQDAAIVERAIAESQAWISVEERRPELINGASSQVVLIYANENFIEMVWLRDADEDGRNLEWILERTEPRDEPITYRHRDGRVTHWMPLPNPPK